MNNLSTQSSTSRSGGLAGRYHSETHPYVLAAVQAELDRLGSTASGRASATFRAACALGGFVAGDLLDPSEAKVLLLEAALVTGLSACEARGQIRRGLKRGFQTPRAIPVQSTRLHVTGPRVLLPAAAIAPPSRPPLEEVTSLWEIALPVSTDTEVTAWFCNRYRVTGLTDLVEIWDLARALPKDARLPRWATGPGGPWTATGHRILFRLWDATGKAVSIRARSVHLDAEFKALAPAGFAVAGLVLADPLGTQILSGAVPEWWHPHEIVINEGEPDWLVWAGRHGDARLEGPAYLGLIAGAWSQDIADRIPDGARVVIRTHIDEPGRKYAEQVVMTLRERCHVVRSRAKQEVQK